MANDHWPLFDLEVRTPRLTLRYLDDAVAAEVLATAARGVHDPAVMPFSIPWTDPPSPRMEQEAMRFYARSRAETRPAGWNLQFAVLSDGDAIGACDLRAVEFPTMREFTTGSWLGLDAQGQGFGKEMRMAALTLGFDGLDAEFACTAAWHDNAPSLGVTRSLGYEQTGWRRELRRGRPDDQLTFRMPRSHWDGLRRDDIEIVGLTATRAFLEV